MSTPDTSAYMIAGYAVFAVVMAAYLISLFLRRRTLENDLAMLEQARPARRSGGAKSQKGGARTGSRKGAKPRKSK